MTGKAVLDMSPDGFVEKVGPLWLGNRLRGWPYPRSEIISVPDRTIIYAGQSCRLRGLFKRWEIEYSQVRRGAPSRPIGKGVVVRKRFTFGLTVNDVEDNPAVAVSLNLFGPFRIRSLAHGWRIEADHEPRHTVEDRGLILRVFREETPVAEISEGPLLPKRGRWDLWSRGRDVRAHVRIPEGILLDDALVLVVFGLLWAYETPGP